MREKNIATHRLDVQSCAATHTLAATPGEPPAPPVARATRCPPALQPGLCCARRPAAPWTQQLLCTIWTYAPTAPSGTQWPPCTQHPLCTGTSRLAALPLLPRLFQGSSFGRNQCLVQAWTNRIKLLAAIFCLVIWHWSIFITVMTCLEVINGWRKTNFVQILLWHICTRQSDTLNIYEVCHFSNTQIESQFTLIYNEIKNLQILLPQYC